MNGKQAKKLRKFYRDGMEKMGMEDAIEYTELMKKKVRKWKLITTACVLFSSGCIGLVFGVLL